MGIKFDWKVDSSRIRAMRKQFPEKLDAFGRAVSAEMVGDMKMSMTESPADTSKSYSRGKTRIHHPSFPKNPPRVDMGTLRASVRWMPHGKGKFKIVDGVEYGVHLEFGTRKMAARPWMTPVFMKWINGEFLKMARAWNWGDASPILSNQTPILQSGEIIPKQAPLGGILLGDKFYKGGRFLPGAGTVFDG